MGRNLVCTGVVVCAIYIGPWFPASFSEALGFFRSRRKAAHPHHPVLVPPSSEIAIIVPVRGTESSSTVQQTINRIRSCASVPRLLHLVVVHQYEEDAQRLSNEVCFDDFKSGQVTFVPSTIGGGGRGAALNQGAHLLSSFCEILLFCHCDTLLPNDFDVSIRNSLEDPNVLLSAFRFGLLPLLEEDESSSWSSWWLLSRISSAANFRSEFWWMPYGDQALALRTRVFEEMGGFHQEFKMMEDFDLVKRLRSRALLSANERLEILPESVLTSSRRWKERGVVKTTVLNWVYCAAFVYFRVSPDQIYTWYYGR